MNILNNGVLNATFDYLTREHFDLSSIWCEYYVHEEFLGLDLDIDWIYRELYSVKEGTNKNIHYFFNVNHYYEKTEFVYALAKIQIGDAIVDGYIFVVCGKVRTVGVFIENKMEPFSRHKDLDEENSKLLTLIKSKLNIDFNFDGNIRYEIERDILPYIPRFGMVEVPYLK